MKYSFPSVVPAAFDKAMRNIIIQWCRLRSPVLAWLWGVKCGAGVVFLGKVLLRTRKRGEISIGDGVVFNALQRANLVGLVNPTILDTRLGGRIDIGGKSGCSSVVMSSMSSICIGRNVLIGGNTRIFDHDFHSVERQYRCSPKDGEYVRTKPIIIGDAVFIGTNVIILKGTNIGEGAVVSAGSVVAGLTVPPYTLVRGNPAVVVRKLS